MKDTSNFLNLKTAKSLAELLDRKFKIGPFSFGLDPIIGLIPGLGDIIPALIAVYLVLLGIKMEIPGSLLLRMLINILLDFVIGIIPVIGDLSDFFFKSNIANYKILEKYA